MTKVTLEELENREDWGEAVLVFTEDSYDRSFSELARSYKVRREEKFFDPSKAGDSLHGDCLDGTEDGVRLDIYMKMLPSEGRRWNVEYAYIVE